MIGEILDGKYHVDQQLGAGGMGNVYLATHLGTTRLVALKVIAPRWAANPQFLVRFQREAQACGRLRHPNIVNVTDFGIARVNGGNIPYLVMEYLDGQTLSAFQKIHPRPALPIVADLLDQIGLALDEAHRHGIVHRDLKPDNIWLEPNGRGAFTVKVLDFGVAKINLLGDVVPRTPEPGHRVAVTAESGTKGDDFETIVIEGTAEGWRKTALDEATETVAMAIPSSPSSDSFGGFSAGQTIPGSLVGTPAYMSPEQALGQETDFRADIYSLAVVAYGLVCGELSAPGTAAALREFHQTGGPPRPGRALKIPPDVSDAVFAGLARNPSERPASAVALTRRFHNAVDAEFLAIRRSKSFLLQHLTAYALLLCPFYGIVLALMALLVSLSKKLLPATTVRAVLVPVAAAALLIFSDNVLRAAAALMALDEQTRVRRFLSFRVFWKLVKMMPALVATQFRSATSFGRDWIIGDALWPVICAVEKLSGRDAVRRSRELMTGLRSAGRALAIRHLALATLAIADLIRSLSFLWQGKPVQQSNVVVNALWFPLFALFAAAPLFLYDRTAAKETGPLLQLDRTPEVPITGRPLSVSSMVWLIAGVIYLIYQPIKWWLFGVR